jgi:predicted nucleic-acid-binding protein
MIGLDTNVIFRYIMQDDSEQVAAAVEVIEGERYPHPRATA